MPKWSARSIRDTARAAVAFTRRISAELRWVGVPTVFGGSPENLEVDVWERRIGLDLFIGPAGAGIEVADAHTSHMFMNGTMNYTGLSDERRVTARLQARF